MLTQQHRFWNRSKRSHETSSPLSVNSETTRELKSTTFDVVLKRQQNDGREYVKSHCMPWVEEIPEWGGKNDGTK